MIKFPRQISLPDKPASQTDQFPDKAAPQTNHFPRQVSLPIKSAPQERLISWICRAPLDFKPPIPAKHPDLCKQLPLFFLPSSLFFSLILLSSLFPLLSSFLSTPPGSACPNIRTEEQANRFTDRHQSSGFGKQKQTRTMKKCL